MNSHDPHIQSILGMIEARTSRPIDNQDIINEIQLAFEFHLINFYEYEDLLIRTLAPQFHPPT